jgi:hypothetical protein
MTKLTETDPTPSKGCNPDSTAEVQAPQVMPSTLSVVVVICVGAMLGGASANAVLCRVEVCFVVLCYDVPQCAVYVAADSPFLCSL